MTITPVRDPLGQVSHFVAIKQDISPRKQAELARTRRLEFEKIIAEISAGFVQNPRIDYAIEYALERLGILEDADRSAIFMADPQQRSISLTHQWHRRVSSQ